MGCHGLFVHPEKRHLQSPLRGEGKAHLSEELGLGAARGHGITCAALPTRTLERDELVVRCGIGGPVDNLGLAAQRFAELAPLPAQLATALAAELCLDVVGLMPANHGRSLKALEPDRPDTQLGQHGMEQIEEGAVVAHPFQRREADGSRREHGVEQMLQSGLGVGPGDQRGAEQREQLVPAPSARSAGRIAVPTPAHAHGKASPPGAGALDG